MVIIFLYLYIKFEKQAIDKKCQNQVCLFSAMVDKLDKFKCRSNIIYWNNRNSGTKY